MTKPLTRADHKRRLIQLWRKREQALGAIARLVLRLDQCVAKYNRINGTDINVDEIEKLMVLI